MGLHAVRDGGLVERWIHYECRKSRLMVAIADQEKRFAWKFTLQPLKKCLIVLHTSGLAAQIFVDRWRVSRIAPARHQIRLPASREWKMVGGEIDEGKERARVVLAPKHLHGGVVVKTVRLALRRPHRPIIEEMFNSRRHLEALGAHEHRRCR